MAANEYYNAPLPKLPGHYASTGPHSPPSPPPLSSYSGYHQEHTTQRTDSPVSPNFDSRSSLYHHTQGQRSDDSGSRFYGAGGGGRNNDSGHFADNIPLQPQSPIPQLGNGGFYGKQSPTDDEPLPGPASRQQRSRQRGSGRKGWFRGKIPWVVYIFTTVQIAVFIAEITRNAILTSSPIAIHPQVNPMLGPSIYVLINMGARYVPCMRSVEGIQDAKDSISWPCPNTTSDDPNSPMNRCSLSDLCGFSGVPNPHIGGSVSDTPQPNQWFRFVVPIFLHAGIIHIAFNMLLQLTLGREMEKEIGSLRFLLVYMSSGIFGFVMGGNFAPSGVASTGASGALFGIIAIMLLDLLYTWKERRSPGKDLGFIILDIVISLALGLLPGLDNFAHIGGFLMGLVFGLSILHSPNVLRERVGTNMPYRAVTTKTNTDSSEGFKGFVQHPMGFFKGRKPLWWVWWLVRAGALIGVLVCFVVLLNNFYKYRNTCSWCKYLSCLPIKNWCDIGNIQLQNRTAKRDVFDLFAPVDLQDFF